MHDFIPGSEPSIVIALICRESQDQATAGVLDNPERLP